MKPRLELLAIATLLAVVDVVHKLMTPTQYHHPRSPFAAAAIAAVVLGLVACVPRLSSRAALLGAGVAAGGALGNLLSLAIWSKGVPDPLVLFGARTGVAFNLADAFALVGDVVLLTAVMIHALRHRAVLHEPLAKPS